MKTKQQKVKKDKKALHIADVSKSVCVVCKTELAVIKGRCCTCHYDCP